MTLYLLFSKNVAMPNKSEAAFLISKFMHLDFILENGVIKNNDRCL